MQKSPFPIAVLLVASVAPAAGQPGSPAGPVPVEALHARRAALLDRMGSGVLILNAANTRSIEGDYPQDSDYREKNDFFYLTGLESPDSWLVLVAREDGPDAIRLYLPPREPRQEQWTGTKLGPGPEAAALSGIEDVRSAEQAEPEIAALLEDPASPLAQGTLFVEISEPASPACLGFPSIVGSSPNSVTLHYDKSRRRMKAGELVVIDIGAEFGYYSADVTRTIPLSGTYTPRQRDIYRLVPRCAAGYDVGDYETPLAPGMVLTVEPGIYIASENLGIRIEDDVLVTATGHELLSKGAPRDPVEIEKVMAKRTTE